MSLYNPADDPAVINGIQEAYGFKIGDIVEFTNQYGLKFSPHRVVGFVQNVNPDWLPENTVYIDSNSPWYPVKPSSLKKITQGGLNMVDPIGADEFFAIAFAKCCHKLTPHPCYVAGWNRCSCMMCIFSPPSHWAGIRKLFPSEYAAICEDESRLRFTLDNKKPLDEFVGDAASCVCRDDPAAIERLITGSFSHTDIYTNDWRFPAGAFKGSAGGPC